MMVVVSFDTNQEPYPRRQRMVKLAPAPSPADQHRTITITFRTLVEDALMLCPSTPRIRIAESSLMPRIRPVDTAAGERQDAHTTKEAIIKKAAEKGKAPQVTERIRLLHRRQSRSHGSTNPCRGRG